MLEEGLTEDFTFTSPRDDIARQTEERQRRAAGKTPLR
jgi:hypothetical protein